MPGTVTVGTGQDETKIQDGRNATPDNMSGQGVWDIEVNLGGTPSANNRYEELIADSAGSSNEDENNYRRFVSMVSQLDPAGYAQPHTLSLDRNGPGVQIYNVTNSTTALFMAAAFTRVEGFSLYRKSTTDCFVMRTGSGAGSTRWKNNFIYVRSVSNLAYMIYFDNTTEHILANLCSWNIQATASGKEPKGVYLYANTGDASCKIYHVTLGYLNSNGNAYTFIIKANAGKTATLDCYNTIAAQYIENSAFRGWRKSGGAGTEIINNYGCVDFGDTVDDHDIAVSCQINKDQQRDALLRMIGWVDLWVYPQPCTNQSCLFEAGHPLTNDPNAAYVNTDINGFSRNMMTPTIGCSNIMNWTQPQNVVYRESPKMYPVRRGGVMKAGK